MFSSFIGIDPAAETFAAGDYTKGKSRTFDNSTEGIKAFLGWLAAQGHEVDTTLICLENTGVYSERLCYELQESPWKMALVEPFKVWKAFGESRPKTDPLDSLKIAEYGARYWDQLTIWQPNPVIVEQVKVLLSTREQLVEQKTALKNTRRALARKVIETPAATSLLEESIVHLKAQIKRIEAEIRRLIEQHPSSAQMLSIIISAPGVGLLMGAHLFVLSQGYRAVPSYRKLANYLGIAPHAFTSGTSVHRAARTRGYGPAIVRKLLHLAARSVCAHKAKYKQYYERKQAQGKSKKLVLNNVSNKLLRLLCSMMANGRPYIEDYQSVNPRLLSA